MMQSKPSLVRVNDKMVVYNFTLPDIKKLKKILSEKYGLKVGDLVEFVNPSKDIHQGTKILKLFEVNPILSKEDSLVVNVRCKENCSKCCSRTFSIKAIPIRLMQCKCNVFITGCVCGVFKREREQS